MWRRLTDAVLEIIYPSRAKCLGCGDESGCEHPFLCEDCLGKLTPEYVTVRREAWRKRGISSVSFVYYYGQPIRGLIRAFKFSGVRMLAKYMADDLARLIDGKAYDMMIPIPLHPNRFHERGFNQAEVLARQIEERLHIPVNTKVLKRIRKTKQQARLSHEKRMRNLEKAFVAKSDVSGKRILLIDDVITTGNTICSCAEALKAAGAAEIHAVSVAGTHFCRSNSGKKYKRRSGKQKKK